ncbi:unnamed protein product [Heterobilharzia americana]|nr:unnamed protein product [Heterobilharzia americana]
MNAYHLTKLGTTTSIYNVTIRAKFVLKIYGLFETNNLPEMSHKQTPRDFLKLIIGRPVVVKLNSGADYRDGYMNVVLEQTEEYVDGQLKNKYGDTFIRGNNAHRQLLPNTSSLIHFSLERQPFGQMEHQPLKTHSSFVL